MEFSNLQELRRKRDRQKQSTFKECINLLLQHGDFSLEFLICRSYDANETGRSKVHTQEGNDHGTMVVLVSEHGAFSMECKELRLEYASYSYSATHHVAIMPYT